MIGAHVLLLPQLRRKDGRGAVNIADDISKAYHEGYKQGRFDAIADIPHGVEKGYSVVAVVRCGECKRCGRLTDGSLFCGRIKTGVYGMYHVVRSDDYCSYGEKMEDKP